MTCKDCIHFEVCDRSSRMMWAAMEGKTECDDFKDRSRYVVREKGEWNTVFYERNGTLSSYSHLCPKCKYFYRDIRFKGHDFCPNCGADMRKGENG